MFRRAFAAVFGLFLTIPFAHAAMFRDAAGTRYAEAVSSLTSRGILQGYPDATIRPGSLITRAEALKILLQTQPRLAQRAQWFAGHLPQMPLFVDVQKSDWVDPFLEAGFENGLVKGYPDRTFRPGDPVNVEEAIVLLMRTYGLHQTSSGEWFQADLDAAIQKNLLARSEHLAIGRQITRGQFFDMVYRLDTVRSRRLTAFVEKDGSMNGHTQLARITPAIVSTMTGKAGNASFSIRIPTLGIQNLAVADPADPTTSKGLLAVLKKGVGHLFSYPGQNGKDMIYGHSSDEKWNNNTYAEIFSTINKLKPGDRVYVTYRGREYVYEVTYQQITAPNDMKSFVGAGEELILYTCWPKDTAKQRLIVHAIPVQEVAQR
ncbi:S-layer homology domain-containing protein [Candidatus Peregrinibacteria bacterium]|nr:S-layer homology domain-containing protein [Candidatus Peregrinibacteria bacterium]MBI3816457.1 S-layer homology domain-containing protein [Candidatus Peregrinibacteria bacterium]